MSKNNPYVPVDEKQSAEIKAKSDALYNEAIQMARRCMATQAFQRFKEKYKAAREALMQEAAYLPMMDPVRYAFFVNNIFERVRSLDALINDVENVGLQPLAGKAQKPKKEA